MIRIIRTLSLGCLVLALTSFGSIQPLSAQNLPDVFAKRVRIMIDNARSMRFLGNAIHSGDKAGMLQNAKVIAEGSKAYGGLFPIGSDVGETRAKPGIWENPDDFRSKVVEYQQAAEALLEIAKSGDPDKVNDALRVAGRACAACHRPYRAGPR